jgi:phage baseplate assembly protein W
MPKDIVGRGFAFHPTTGLDVNANGGMALTNERNEIQQAIEIILMTPIGHRVMRPWFGSRLHELLFEPNNAETAARAAQYAEEALLMWEPRITIQEITARPDDEFDDIGCLLLEISYIVKATNDPRSLVYPFYLIPEE